MSERAKLRLLFRLTFVLAAVIAVDVAVEVAGRARRALPAPQGDLAIPDPVLGFRFRPWTTWHDDRWARSTIRTGEHGRRLGRDEPLDLSKVEVLFVGDSMTFAAEVDDEDTLPSRFEALSGRRSLNAGVRAYSTVQAMLASSEWLPRLPRCRAVVYLYCVNDLLENVCEGPGGAPTAGSGGGISLPGHGDPRPVTGSPENMLREARERDGARILGLLLRGWRVDLESRGVRLVAERCTDRPGAPERPDPVSFVALGGAEFEAACAAAGVEHVDPGPLFALPPESYHAEVLGRPDAHLNVVGTTTLAAALLPKFRE